MMNKKIKGILLYVIQLLVMVVVTYVVFTIVVRPIRIVGPSMTPTVHNGDFAIMNVIGLKLDKLKRFDVVVIDCDKLGEDLIKRVIGLPGETIEYKDDQLYVNGAVVPEVFFDLEFIETSKRTHNTEVFTRDFSATIPDGEYFVLGDNRLSSQDSRTLGTFTMKDMLGKGGITIFPFKHFSWIK